MKIRPVGAELFHADGRTDLHDETNSRFAQFVYAFWFLIKLAITSQHSIHQCLSNGSAPCSLWRTNRIIIRMSCKFILVLNTYLLQASYHSANVQSLSQKYTHTHTYIYIYICVCVCVLISYLLGAGNLTSIKITFRIFLASLFLCALWINNVLPILVTCFHLSSPVYITVHGFTYLPI